MSIVSNLLQQFKRYRTELDKLKAILSTIFILPIVVGIFLVLVNWLFDMQTNTNPTNNAPIALHYKMKNHHRSAQEIAKILNPVVAITNIHRKYDDWSSNQLSDRSFNYYLMQQDAHYTKLLTDVYDNLLSNCSDDQQLRLSQDKWTQFKQNKLTNSNYTLLQKKTIKVLLEIERVRVLEQMKSCTDSDGLINANNYEQRAQSLINF